MTSQQPGQGDPWGAQADSTGASPEGGAQQGGVQPGGYQQQGGHQPGGEQPGGYQQGGYQQGGYQQGAQPGGYQQSSYQQGGYPEGGYQQGYPQPGYAQGGYPAGAGGTLQTSKPKPPGTVTGALVIYLLQIVFSIVAVFLVVNSDIWKQAINDAATETQTQLSGATVDTVVNTAKTVTIVVGVVLAGLMLMFAFFMWGGRNWARVVLTVLSALSILSGITSAAGAVSGSVTVNGRTYEAGSSWSTWVAVVLAVLAIVLMYLPQSNAYFRDSKIFRAQPYRA